MDPKTSALPVQVLYFEGCPDTPPMIRAVETAVGRLGESWTMELVDLEALSTDDLRRG